jgi:hypothetical protein
MLREREELRRRMGMMPEEQQGGEAQAGLAVSCRGPARGRQWDARVLAALRAAAAGWCGAAGRREAGAARQVLRSEPAALPRAAAHPRRPRCPPPRRWAAA